MENNDSARTCPKCGMNLGQKHLCPVCDMIEENAEARPNPAGDFGVKLSRPLPSPMAETDVDNSRYISIYVDYVSRVIEFVGGHPDDWDNEFNAFFDGLSEKPDYMKCYDACSKVSGIRQKDWLVSVKIPGSMTIEVMNELKTIFRDLPDKEARPLALSLLEKRLEAVFAPPPSSDSTVMNMYRKALKQNDAYAQCELGRYYSGYWNDAKDSINLKEAFKWFRLAAEQGEVEAQYYLGRCYENSLGVSQDKEEAMKWYRKAAEQGHQGARVRAGL
jgi:hypothetical protein